MTQWDRIYASEDYRRLIQRKTRTVVVLTVFFVVYYFLLPVSVGTWPELMETKVWGNVSLAYAYAFSQFLMAWAVAFAYMRRAERYDRDAARILAAASASGQDAQTGGGR